MCAQALSQSSDALSCNEVSHHLMIWPVKTSWCTGAVDGSAGARGDRSLAASAHGDGSAGARGNGSACTRGETGRQARGPAVGEAYSARAPRRLGPPAAQ
jgi:hypothetical protein